MERILFDISSRPGFKILCLGAHSDDIEIGCGGTVLRLLEEHPNLEILWVVLSGTGSRAQEARASAENFLQGAQAAQVIIHTFRDSYFPYQGGEVKEFVAGLKELFSPDLIFTHQRDDLHQDHRLLSELTWNTFRDHVILEYEIPKYDGDLGKPNFYVELSEEVCERKIDLLQKHFTSQKEKPWFRRETFLAILTLRGIETGSKGPYAEAFYNRKIVY